MSEIVTIDHKAVKGRVLDKIRELIPMGKTIYVKNIESSNVSEFRYFPRTKRLLVTFKSGRRYRYDNVQSNTVENFANAKSKGKFMWNDIIGKYPTKRTKSVWRYAAKFNPNAIYNSDNYLAFANHIGEDNKFNRGNFSKIENQRPLAGILVSNDGRSVIIAEKDGNFHYYDGMDPDIIWEMYQSPSRNFFIDNFSHPDVTTHIRNFVGRAVASRQGYRGMRYKNYDAQKDMAVRASNTDNAKNAFNSGKPVEFTQKKSEMIKGIRYIPNTKRLTVIFRNGDQYEYSGVPPKMALDMATSAQPGGFYLEFIRGRIPSTQTVNQ